MATLFKTEAEWLTHVETRQKRDSINDNPDNKPDSYPCLMVEDSYCKNSRGWWRWTFEFLYPEDCVELMEAAGYGLIEPGKQIRDVYPFAGERDFYD